MLIHRHSCATAFAASMAYSRNFFPSPSRQSSLQIPRIRNTGFTKFTFSCCPVTPPDTCEYYSGQTEALVPVLGKRPLRAPKYTAVKDLSPAQESANLLVKVVKYPVEEKGAKGGDGTRSMSFFGWVEIRWGIFIILVRTVVQEWTAAAGLGLTFQTSRPTTHPSRPRP